MRIDILTLFPEMFGPVLGTSIPKRAAAKGLVSYHLTNIRDFATDAHLSVDDKPFGGGPGMVMMCPVVFAAVEHVESLDSAAPLRILLTPQGRRFDQALAEELATKPRLLLIAGHYEGFDERISLGLQPLELSIGDFVLSGGELAAMVVIDAVVRLLPGALGAETGAADETFADGLIEYPQYTRPREFRGMGVPDILLSGNHAAIAAWRGRQREERTRDRRPDLWQSHLQRNAKSDEKMKGDAPCRRFSPAEAAGSPAAECTTPVEKPEAGGESDGPRPYHSPSQGPDIPSSPDIQQGSDNQ